MLFRSLEMAFKIIPNRNSRIRDGIPSSAAGVKDNARKDRQGLAGGGAGT